MTLLRSGSATDVGRVRASNQDVALEEPDLFAVADGMGGHVGGEVAARVAIDALRDSFRKQPTVEGLRRAVAEANRDVWRKGQAESGLRGMGTTLTATALVRDPSGRQVIALANVGDSRAYVFSRGQVIQITADHSLAEERVRQGEMTEAEAAIHPHRHILTRALGVSSDVDVDLWELHLADGDRILLCSDGLTNEVDDEEIGRVLASRRDPGEAARALVRTAVDHGGNDNVTVVVVDVVSADEAAGPPVDDRQRLPGGDPGAGDMPTTSLPTLSAPPDGVAGPDDPAVDAHATAAHATDATAADATTTTPAARADHDDTTGVLPAVGAAGSVAAGTLNGRSGSRALGADRATGAGAGDSGARTGVVTATRPPDGAGDKGAGQPQPPTSPRGTRSVDPTSTTRPDAGPGAGAESITGQNPTGQNPAGQNPAGQNPAGQNPTGQPIARATTRIGSGRAPAGPRPPGDFGSQAAELRRLRPTRRERRHRRRTAGVPRLITVRVVLFLVLLLAVVAAAYYLVRWYAMDDWYVTVDHQHLAIYQGRPGGFLWFKPKLVTDTPVTTQEILPFHLPTVEADHQKPSLQAARRYVADLHQEYLATQPTAGSTTSTTGGSATSTTTTTTAAST